MANSVTHNLPFPIQNARYSLAITFRLSTGVPTDPTTPDTEFSTDGGATFTDCAEEIATGGSNGMGYLTLTGAETNTKLLLVAAKSANCITTPVVLHCRNLATVGSGTLSAGSSGGGTLGTLLIYDVTGCFIRTTGGTGGGGTGGANNQARRILTYNTTTGAFTVNTWETTPDATTTYDVLMPEGVTLGMLRTLEPTLVLPTAPTANTYGEAMFLADILGGRFGTAQTGAATTITLDAGASSVDSRYNGYMVYLYGGTGGGVRGVGQARTITAYNGTTKVATVDSAWGTNPDSTTKFMLIVHPILNASYWGGVAVTGMPMPTYAQPSGFLAATFPIGTIASTINITAASGVSLAASQHVIVDSGTVTTVSGNVNGSVGSVTGSVGSVTGAVGSVVGNVGGNVTGSVGSVVGAVGSVTGDVGGKVLGGGAGTITAAGAWVLNAAGAALAPASTALSTVQWTNTLATNLGTLAGHDPGATLGTSTLTQTQVTGGAYSVQSSSCVLGDARIAHLDADVTSRAPSATALSTVQWTSARAGYIDNLNVGGAVASHADIDALNQSASRRVLLATVGQYERPETGAVTYTVEARTYDGDGAAVNADSTPTLTATGIVSGSLAANLSVASNPSAGLYRWTYTVSSTDTVEQVRFDLSATISTAVFTMSAYTQVADLVGATWTTTDATHLTAVFNKLPSNNIADETLVLAAVGSPMQAGSTVVLTDASLTTAKLGTFVLAKTTNITGFNDVAATAIVSAGAITTSAGAVVTVANLTNAPTAGDFTATMKASLNAATPASVVGNVGGIAGTTQTLDALQTVLNSAHGAGSWATATGFSILDAAGVRTAVGLATNNLDTQLGAIGAKTSQLTFTVAGHVDATATATVDTSAVAIAILSAVVPDGYASGTAGAALGRIGSGQISTTSVVAQNGNIRVTRGDDYYVVDGRSFDWTDISVNWPDLTGAAIVVSFFTNFGATATLTAAGSVVTPTGGSKKVRLELPRASSVLLAQNGYDIAVVATLSNGDRVTLVVGQASVTGHA